jgi:uncharacterized membrane protein YozB (DUF420 family)
VRQFLYAYGSPNAAARGNGLSVNNLFLPAVNAGLNATSALLLVLGYIFIRQRALTAHTMTMLGACSTSTLFLISYIYYHLNYEPLRYQGTGFFRILYFAMLISHTILAVAVVPFAIGTLIHALRGKFQKHRAWARWTFPIWIYVSVTGVLIYWVLYGKT